MSEKREQQPRRSEMEVSVRCANGIVGVYREEVWQDAFGNVIKYNLAFINHGLCSKDNGRVLGYDNAHGFHERHWMGRSEPFAYDGFDPLQKLFADEVAELRKRKR